MSDEKLVKDLVDIAGRECVVEGEPMAAHTTFRIGGPADVFVAAHSAEDIVRVVGRVRESGERLYILGRGSNVLVSDEGVHGVVVQIAGNLANVEMDEGGMVSAEAGVTNSKLAALACRAGLAGYEFAAGIPGTVGGAAIMNAGAYDGEFRHVARSVTCLDCEGTLKELGPDEARWGYRTSALLDEGLIVLSAKLELEPGDPAAIQARMDDLASRRTEKQPLDKPSAGSTFKRPPGRFAGKLIQDAGMQGHRVGGAQVSTKHAGFVVNVGDATAADVVQVMRDVRDAVEKEFGVRLEAEVRFWGFDTADGTPAF